MSNHTSGYSMAQLAALKPHHFFAAFRWQPEEFRYTGNGGKKDQIDTIRMESIGLLDAEGKFTALRRDYKRLDEKATSPSTNFLRLQINWHKIAYFHEIHQEKSITVRDVLNSALRGMYLYFTKIEHTDNGTMRYKILQAQLTQLNSGFQGNSADIPKQGFKEIVNEKLDEELDEQVSHDIGDWRLKGRNLFYSVQMGDCSDEKYVVTHLPQITFDFYANVNDWVILKPVAEVLAQ